MSSIRVVRKGDVTHVTLASGETLSAPVYFGDVPMLGWVKKSGPTVESPDLTMRLRDLITAMSADGASDADVRAVFNASRELIEQAKTASNSLSGQAQRGYRTLIEDFRRQLLDQSGPSVGLIW